MKRMSAFVFVLALAACGGRPPVKPVPPPPQPPPQPVTAALHVGVRDAKTGLPIGDARVDVSAIPGEDDGRTSATGYWGVQLPLTGPGDSYRLEVHKDGYVSFGADVVFGVETDVTARLEPVVVEPPVTMPWAGRLRVAAGARGYVDDAGRWQLPVLAHYGEAFSAFVHGKTVDGGLTVEEQLRLIKAAGYDGIRFWDTLGYYAPPWDGKEVMPWAFTNRPGQRVEATPDYYVRLREFVALVKRLGLTVHHARGDLNGRGVSEVVRHTERVAAIYDELGWDTVALFEANNEDFQNGSFGPDGLRRIAEPGARRGAITASSCPAGCTEEPSDLAPYSQGFPIFYVHGFRAGQVTDILRHIFSLGYEIAELAGKRIGWQGEPTGPNEFPGFGVTVGSVEDREALGLFAFQSLMSRQAWVYMSQYGVFWNGGIHRHRGFRVVPKMRAALAAFAADVMSWSTLVHGGRSEAALCVPAGCRGGNYFGDPGVASGPARVDQAISPDRRKVVAVVHGGRPPFVLRNHLGCDAVFTVVWPRDDEEVQTDEVQVNAGSTFELPAYRAGRGVMGRCR